jgi:chromosome partitioning protein
MADDLRWSRRCGGFATSLERLQRKAIERENAPERQKVLRMMSIPEAAGLLEVPVGDVIRECRQREIEQKGRLSFADFGRLRESLYAKTGDRRFRPTRAQGDELACVVFANFKGGSGKTTSSVHFAQYMARRGYRILLVDLDSQGSATGLFGLDPGLDVGEHDGFAGWVLAEEGEELRRDRLVRGTYWPTIDLVPAGPGLSGAEDLLTTRLRGEGGEHGSPFEELANFLATVESGYDVAVVDVRPDVNILMACAHQAADGLIVPVRPMMGDLQSTGSFLRYLAKHYERAEGKAPIQTKFVKVLVTQFDPTDPSEGALVSIMRRLHPEMMLDGEFLDSRVMGSSHYAKETLFEYEPQGDRAAYARVLASVNGICRAIEAEVVAGWGRSLSSVKEIA